MRCYAYQGSFVHLSRRIYSSSIIPLDYEPPDNTTSTTDLTVYMKYASELQILEYYGLPPLCHGCRTSTLLPRNILFLKMMEVELERHLV